VVQVHYDEGVANRVDPSRACLSARAGRSVGRGAHRPAIEPRKFLIRMPTLSKGRKATPGGRVIASARLVRRGRRPWHVRKLSVFREPGDLASGRAGFAAALVRVGKVRSRSR